MPAFILLSPPVGFRLWLLPSDCSFGLKTGEVNCCFGLICGNEVSEQLHLTELLGHLCLILAVICKEETPAHAQLVSGM